MTMRGTPPGEVKFVYMIKSLAPTPLLFLWRERKKYVCLYSLPYTPLFLYNTNSKSPPSTEKWARASFYRAISSIPFRVETLLLEVFLFSPGLVPKSTDE
jgi:hypothetical protein